jgi:hypothetical protein
MHPIGYIVIILSLLIVSLPGICACMLSSRISQEEERGIVGGDNQTA